MNSSYVTSNKSIYAYLLVGFDAVIIFTPLSRNEDILSIRKSPVATRVSLLQALHGETEFSLDKVASIVLKRALAKSTCQKRSSIPYDADVVNS